MKEKVVALLSGGVDSTTLVYHLAQNYEVWALTILYGQKHAKELEAAKDIASLVCTKHEILDLNTIQPLLKSALTSSELDVPSGHYTEESMKITVVPCRNLLFLICAAAWAMSNEITKVAYAAHAGDHYIYPDCRPSFVQRTEDVLREYNPEIRVLAPFVNLSKAEIVGIGLGLGVDYSKTWSCYKGNEKACGTCGTCRERLEAFELNGVEDLIEYETD